MKILMKVEKGAFIPKRMTIGAAGYDLFSFENIIIEPQQTKLIKTGVSVELPEEYEVQIRPRSGLSLKHDVIAIMGTIDSDYRGEIGVIMRNNGTKDFVINIGDRIAQAVFAKVELPEIIFTDTLNETKRGNAGFGSTGIVAEQAKELERLVRQVMKND